MKTLFSLTLLVFGLIAFADEVAPTNEKAAAVEGSKPAEKATVADTAYTGEALNIQKKMSALFDVSKKVNDKGPERAKARAGIENSMDWDKIAEVCLGSKKWKSESAGNKGQFKNLLKDVIVKTAYTRLDKFWADGTTYDFAKIDVKGTQAVVLSKFNVKGDSFGLEYFMTKKGTDWLIWDIAYENERYSVNINEQIDAFLREKGFANLLEKLRKRKADLEQESSKG